MKIGGKEVELSRIEESVSNRYLSNHVFEKLENFTKNISFLCPKLPMSNTMYATHKYEKNLTLDC